MSKNYALFTRAASVSASVGGGTCPCVIAASAGKVRRSKGRGSATCDNVCALTLLWKTFYVFTVEPVAGFVNLAGFALVSGAAHARKFTYMSTVCLGAGKMAKKMPQPKLYCAQLHIGAMLKKCKIHQFELAVSPSIFLEKTAIVS